MRAFRTAVLIIGLFLPSVIQGQPFGDTEMTVYDVDFLPPPSEPPLRAPEEPPVPVWIEWVPPLDAVPLALPSVPPLEFLS